MNFIYLLSSFLLVQNISTAYSNARKFREVFNWRYLDYTYPTDTSRQEAIERGNFIPENNLPVGIEVWKNKLFVTVPRWKNGVPSTLNYIPLDVGYSSSPKLAPYPSWNYNQQGNCNGLTTTYRVKADKCNRLWVLDSGTLGIGNTTQQLCPYALHVFDLQSDRRLRKYQFRSADVNADTFIANLAVDIGSGGCEDTMAYASDELGYGLIVYSWQQHTSWRFEHSFFMPDPLAGDYNIANLNFQWGDEGIFGMALTPIQKDGYRRLLFHPLSSYREFFVSTEVLRNENKVENSYHDFVPLRSRAGNAHVTAQVMDDNGILYFNLVDQNAVGCWNSQNAYTPENHGIVEKDDVGLIFPSDIKVQEDTGLLWVISDRMPVHLIATLDFSDVNFRIFNVRINEAITGTVCEPYSPSNHYGYAPSTRITEQENRHNIIQLPATINSDNTVFPKTISEENTVFQQNILAPKTISRYGFNRFPIKPVQRDNNAIIEPIDLRIFKSVQRDNYSPIIEPIDPILKSVQRENTPIIELTDPLFKQAQRDDGIAQFYQYSKK